MLTADLGETMTIIRTVIFSLFMAFSAAAQDAPPPPASPAPDEAPAPAPELNEAALAKAQILLEAVLRIDPEAELMGNGAQFNVGETRVILVFDVSADRMRLMSPVGNTGALDADLLYRLMQANFDSALDARYAVAQGTLWSTFIHPMSSLTLSDFASGIGQTVNLVDTFGTSFSSGALLFGGGDSEAEQRKLIDDLLGQLVDEI